MTCCCIIPHCRHCKPLLSADADVFSINPKPHSTTHCGVIVRLRPANHGGAHFLVGPPKNTLGAVLWPRAPSVRGMNALMSQLSVRDGLTCLWYLCSPILCTIFKFTLFSHFSSVGICIICILWELLHSFYLLLLQYQLCLFWLF